MTHALQKIFIDFEPENTDIVVYWEGQKLYLKTCIKIAAFVTGWHKGQNMRATLGAFVRYN